MARGTLTSFLLFSLLLVLSATAEEVYNEQSEPVVPSETTGIVPVEACDNKYAV